MHYRTYVFLVFKYVSIIISMYFEKFFRKLYKTMKESISKYVTDFFYSKNI